MKHTKKHLPSKLWYISDKGYPVKLTYIETNRGVHHYGVMAGDATIIQCITEESLELLTKPGVVSIVNEKLFLTRFNCTKTMLRLHLQATQHIVNQCLGNEYDQTSGNYALNEGLDDLLHYVARQLQPEDLKEEGSEGYA